MAEESPGTASAPRRASSSPRATTNATDWAAARTVLRDLADEPCRSPTPRPARSTARGGNEWFGPAVWTLDRSRRDLDPFERGPRLRGRRGAGQGGVEPRHARWRPLCRRAAGRPLPQRRRRRRPGAISTACRSTRRAPHWKPGGAGLILHSLGRRTPRTRSSIWVGISAAGVFHTGRRRQDLGAAQPRHPRRLHARRPELSRIRPVRAQSGDGGRHARPPLPAEPLRHVSQRRWRQDLAEHREGPAVDLRLSGGRPSARPRHALSSCRSTATSPAATCRTPRPPSGARATRGADLGRRCATACRSRTPIFGVLRQAMATDRLEPAGVYFGTSSGSLFASADEGESWTRHRRASADRAVGRDARRRCADRR